MDEGNHCILRSQYLGFEERVTIWSETYLRSRPAKVICATNYKCPTLKMRMEGPRLGLIQLHIHFITLIASLYCDMELSYVFKQAICAVIRGTNWSLGIEG